jgi:hypothetical protein
VHPARSWTARATASLVDRHRSYLNSHSRRAWSTICIGCALHPSPSVRGAEVTSVSRLSAAYRETYDRHLGIPNDGDNHKAPRLFFRPSLHLQYKITS